MKSPNPESYITHKHIRNKILIGCSLHALCQVLEVLNINKHNIYSLEGHSQVDMTDLCETSCITRQDQTSVKFIPWEHRGRSDEFCLWRWPQQLDLLLCVSDFSQTCRHLQTHLLHSNLKITFYLVHTDHIVTPCVFFSD